MTWNTGGGWVILFGAILVIECWALGTHRRTLSEQVWAGLRQRPVTVAFFGGLGAGLLLGHLFL